MSKKKRRRQSKKLRISIVVALIVLIIIAAICFFAGKSKGKSNETDSGKVSGQEKEESKSTELFDDDRLKLIGSMEYEGPDFDDESMEEGDYTMLMIQNVSGSFLRNAEIEVKVNDSEKMKLVIDSLPTGETAMVIGQEYNAFSEDAVYQVVSCKSVYEETIIDKKEGLDVICENGNIQVINQSAEDMSNVTVRYKGKVNDMLLGGITYEFTMDSLAAGQTFETFSQSFLAESIQVVEVN